MYDPSCRRGPLNRQELWTCIILVLVLLGLFAAEIYHNFEPVKLAALLVVLFWVPLLAVHEAGHALVAALTGWHVGQVVIGMGRTAGQFKIGSAVVEVRLLPLEGFVRCVPTDLRFPRLKSALIYFAGPGIELLLAGVILALVGPAAMLSRSNDYGIIAWQSLAVASAAQGILNLIPTAIQTPDGPVANDGLGIIRSFLWPESHYAAMIGWRYNYSERTWQENDAANG
jgi:membrane-associated protease RseP (regulator of RpoE activity)